MKKNGGETEIIDELHKSSCGSWTFLRIIY